MVDGGEVVWAEVRLRRATVHSRRLLPADRLPARGGLGSLRARSRATPSPSGPGSFTGLRVGLSTVQGLALAAGRPCLGVSTLDVLAAARRGAAPTLVADDRRRTAGEVFAALYDGEARARERRRPRPPEAVAASAAGPAAFIGRRRRAVPRGDPGRGCRTPSSRARSLYLAGTLARLAEPRLRGRRGDGAGRPAAAVPARPADIRKRRRDRPRRSSLGAGRPRRRRRAGQPRAALLHAIRGPCAGFRDALRRGERGPRARRCARPGRRRTRSAGSSATASIETAADELHVHNLAVRPGAARRRPRRAGCSPSRSRIGERRGARGGAPGGAREQPARHRALPLDGLRAPSPCAAELLFAARRRTPSSSGRTGSAAPENNLEIARVG